MPKPGTLIPYITDRRLDALRRKIVPLMRYHDLVGGVRVSTFTAQQDGEERPLYRLDLDGLKPRDSFGARKPSELAIGLREFGRATFFSTFQSFFWPSEAEVLAQMPEHFEDHVIAYEATMGREALYHRGLDTYFRATAIFYAKE